VYEYVVVNTFLKLKIYLTRKSLIEIKNLLYKRVLTKTAAAAHYTKFQIIKHKTVTDNIQNKKDTFFFRSQHE